MIDTESKEFKYLKFLGNVALEQESVSRCRLAALLVHKNMPIALGINQMKSHPMQARFGMNEHAIYLHAEIDAIVKALKDLDEKELSKCTLYVCRVLKDGAWGIAKPCPGCQKALKSFGIKKIVWSTENGFSTSEHESLNEDNALYENRRAANGKKNQALYLSKYRYS